jgi:hypothetical protein
LVGFRRKMRLRRFLPLGLVLVACSSKNSAPFGESNSGGAVDAGPPPVGTLVWKPTSDRIELISTSFFNGSWGYDRLRADLTPQQLSALEQMKTMAPDTGRFAADVDFLEITITDRDGSKTKFQATSKNFHGSVPDPTLTPIDFRTLSPFIQTTACEKGTRPIERSSETRLDPSAAPQTPALPKDLACLTGIRLSGRCSDTVFKVTPPSDGSFTFSIHRCLDVMSLRLYTGDGKTMLEEAALGGNTADPCVSLAATMSTTESYLLMMTRTVPGCATAVDAKDVFVRMQPTK